MSGRPSSLGLEGRLSARLEPELNTGCWLWSGATSAGGYGSIRRTGAERRQINTHRAAWEVHRGPIPDGLSVLHRCDTPACCNPAHLFLGTQHDNMVDKIVKGRARRPQGEAAPGAKLSTADVVEMRRLRMDEGLTQAALAGRYGISAGVVQHILAGRKWKHLL